MILKIEVIVFIFCYIYIIKYKINLKKIKIIRLIEIFSSIKLMKWSCLVIVALEHERERIFNKINNNPFRIHINTFKIMFKIVLIL